jgi:hypothetical protein
MLLGSIQPSAAVVTAVYFWSKMESLERLKPIRVLIRERPDWRVSAATYYFVQVSKIRSVPTNGCLDHYAPMCDHSGQSPESVMALVSIEEHRMISGNSEANARGPSWRGRIRRLTRWLVAALTVLICVLLAAWNAFPPVVPQSPLKLVRGEDGKFTNESDSSDVGASLQLHAGQINASNRTTSASSETVGGRARLAGRRILVQNKSDHLLAKRIAGDFLEELKKLSCVDTITYLPAGEIPQPGELSPDVFITLTLADLNESGLIDQLVDAKLIVTMGSAPAADNHSVSDTLSPPVVQVRWKCQLDHQSTTREVASSAAKYKLVAEDIAKHLGGVVVKQLGSWRDKYDLLPELPSEFYPEYHAPPELPLEGMESTITFSGHGLLKHNDTVWRCTIDKALPEAIALLRDRLETAGWNEGEGRDENRLAMKGPHGRLTAFGENADGFGIGLDKAPTEKSKQPPDETLTTKPTTFFVRYEEYATSEERATAIDKLFDSGVPIQTAMMFENDWTVAQRKKLLDRFAEHPPTSAEQWLVLANIQRGDKNDDAARDALRRSVALLRVAHDASDVKSKLTQLAKELGDEKLVEKLEAEPPDFELLKELGYLEISAVGPAPPVEFDLDGAANYLVRKTDGDWQLISFSAKPTANNRNQGYQLGVGRALPHSRSFSSGQMLNERHPVQQLISIDGLERLHFEIIQQPGLPRFTVTTELQPVQADGSPLTETPTTDPGPGDQ